MAKEAAAALSEEKKSYESLKSYHTQTGDQLLKQFNVDINQGLNDKQVEENRTKFGKNEFPAEDSTPLWVLILKQFQDLLVIILIAAALISLVLAFFEENEDEKVTAFVEPMVIVFILIVNATVGVLQESSAEKAVEALKAYSSDTAKIIRGGKLSQEKAEALVVGDIVDVEIGDRIPADIRLLTLSSSTMDAEQSMLTGESDNVAKITKPVADEEGKAQIQDKINTVFSGTTLTRGKGRGIVISVGVHTEKGKIRDSLKVGDDETKFPLKEKLDEFGTLLSKVIGVICVVVWVMKIGHFSDPAFGSWFKGAIYYFKIAVSLAVAAIPEGLPAVVTTCLALGTQRMSKRNAIVTVLPAVETLGCTTVICSDKTGTLTTNQMSVQRFFVLGDKGQIEEFAVEGRTYATFDIKTKKSLKVTPTSENSKALAKPSEHEGIKQLARIASLCNDSHIEIKNDTFSSIGQSTEAAMKVLVEKIGIPGQDPAELEKKSTHDRVMACNSYWSTSAERVFTLEFDRDRKSMSVLVKPKEGKPELLVKGAWDNVLNRCSHANFGGKIVALDDGVRENITKFVEAYCTGENCFRCLCFATVTPSATPEQISNSKPEDFAQFESKMTFVGVVGILDPPREEVTSAIEECHNAGIRVIMITGDNISTATAICRKIGIFKKDEDTKGKAFTGQEFKKLTKTQKLAAVKDARLFARVEPIDKRDLVSALHAQKHVVAMTGDGVNDAPALKKADIGIAMGSGTAVAKGAAKMILADDNFTTIVGAVEEGRNIYNNTKQFIRYLISANFGEVVSIFACAILGLPEVLLPVQLLWVNLVTDGLPAVALGFNKPEAGIMLQPPRPRDEPIVGRQSMLRFILVGTYIGIATTFGMIWWFMFYSAGPHLTWAQLFEWDDCTPESSTPNCLIFEDKHPNTMSLSVLVTIEMFHALNSLSERNSIIHPLQHPFTNPILLAAMTLSFSLHCLILYVPFLASVFSVAPLSINEWIAVLCISAPVILIEEVFKFFLRSTAKKAKHVD